MGLVSGVDFVSFLHFDLHCVESFAINSVNVGLSNESVGVNAFYDSEDCDGFNFTTPDHEDFDFFL